MLTGDLFAVAYVLVFLYACHAQLTRVLAMRNLPVCLPACHVVVLCLNERTLLSSFFPAWYANDSTCPHRAVAFRDL